MAGSNKLVLDQILKRLDKMENQQCKLDRVMERLDTLQNILEKQNQKQNLLDEKLVEMTVKLEQEKSAMTEQPQGAQKEISEPPRDLQGNRGSRQPPHKSTQSLPVWGNQVDDKLKIINDRTAETAQKCHHLTAWSHKMEEKMAEFAETNNEIIKTFLIEIRSVKDLIKGQTNSELIWLNNQLDKKLSDIGSVVREMFQQQNEAKEETVHSTEQVVKTVIQQDKQDDANELLNDKQMQAVLDLERKIEQLHSSVLDAPREMQTFVETLLTTNKQFITDLENTIINSIAGIDKNTNEQSLSNNKTLKTLFEAVQSELQTSKKIITELQAQTGKLMNATKIAREDLRHLIQTKGDNTGEKLENMQTSINSLTKSSNALQLNMTTVVKTSIDSTKEAIICSHTTVNNNLKKLTSDLKYYIDMAEREIVNATEKEGQTVSDQIKELLPARGTYTWYFSKIFNFTVWIISIFFMCMVASSVVHEVKKA